jgi:hypothetical protein
LNHLEGLSDHSVAPFELVDYALRVIHLAADVELEFVEDFLQLAYELLIADNGVSFGLVSLADSLLNQPLQLIKYGLILCETSIDFIGRRIEFLPVGRFVIEIVLLIQDRRLVAI